MSWHPHTKKALFALGRLKTGEMNKTERSYCNLLEGRMLMGEILWFKFEGIKLRLADNCFYTADFAVMRADGQLEMHEIKGAWAIFEDDAKVKIKVAAELYPFRFIAAVPVPQRKGGGWETRDFSLGQVA